MKNPYLIGRKIYLRVLSKSDITDRYLSWLNDEEVTKYIDTAVFPTTKQGLKDFYKKIHESKNDIMFAIVDKRKDLHIGNIKLGNISWVHRYADLGIMIGEKKYWGKSCGEEATKLLLNYAFRKLNLNKVILGVSETHTSAMKTYERVGFKIEGRIRNLLYIDDKYCDKIIMGIAREDFLKKGYISFEYEGSPSCR